MESLSFSEYQTCPKVSYKANICTWQNTSHFINQEKHKTALKNYTRILVVKNDKQIGLNRDKEQTDHHSA